MKYTTGMSKFHEFWDLSKVLKERNCPIYRLLLSYVCIIVGCENLVEAGILNSTYCLYIGRELQVSVTRQGRAMRSSYNILNCAANLQVKEQSKSLEIIDRTYFVPEGLIYWLIRRNEEHGKCRSSNGRSVCSVFLW